MTQPQPLGYSGGERAVLLSHGLPHGLQRFEALVFFDGMNAQTVGGAVVDGGEDRHLAVLLGERRGGIGSPHLIGLFRNDGPLVWGPRALGMLTREETAADTWASRWVATPMTKQLTSAVRRRMNNLPAGRSGWFRCVC